MQDGGLTGHLGENRHRHGCLAAGLPQRPSYAGMNATPWSTTYKTVVPLHSVECSSMLNTAIGTHHDTTGGTTKCTTTRPESFDQPVALS